jgi:hypothetical protein
VQGKHKASLATVIALDQAAPLNLAPADAAAALDLVVPATTPLTGEQWDRLDEAVDEIDGGREKVESEVAALGDAPRKIMVGECSGVEVLRGEAPGCLSLGLRRADVSAQLVSCRLP